jgi:hypothetical protein
MRSRKLGGGRPRPVSPRALRGLDELVCTVAALHGPRAQAMLSGLSDVLRPAALELVAQVEPRDRAERHALLASAFAARSAALATAQLIPGRLGSEVRKLLASRVSAAAVPGSGKMERWARRILLEDPFHSLPGS